MRIPAWILAIGVFFLDQLSKFIASAELTLHQPAEVIKNVFYLTLVHNTGAAFGIFKNQALFFIVISVAAVASLIFYIRGAKDNCFLKNIAFALIIGGALGNLCDRLRFGYVVDFLDFRVWPVFNIADSAITIGAALIMFSLARAKPPRRG